MTTLPGLNYATPLTLTDLEHLEQVYSEEFVERLLAIVGHYRAGGASIGILSEIDPTLATDTSEPFFVETNAIDGMTVDVQPGVAFTPSGQRVLLTAAVSSLAMINQEVGQQNVVFVEYLVVPDEDTTVTTRFLTAEARQYRRAPDNETDPLKPRTLQVASMQDWQNNTLFPPERRLNIVPLALVSIVSSTTSPYKQTSVDLSRTSLTINRPWFTPVDIEHRSQEGTGAATVPHRLGLNDLSQGNLTLYQQLLNYGIVLSRDQDAPGVPGKLCLETVTTVRVKTDVTGEVTGTLSQLYVTLTRFPDRLLGAYSLSDTNNELLVELLPHRNILLIHENELVPAGGILVLYSTIDAGEPLTDSLLNDELLFRQPLVGEELVISGGRAFEELTPSVTDAFANVRARISLSAAPAIPRRYRVFADDVGTLFSTPQHILCATKLDDIGLALFNFTTPMFGTARIRVGLQSVDLAASTVVTIRFTGVDNQGSTVNEDVTFDFTNFENPVVGGCVENPLTTRLLSTVFTDLQSMTVLSRVADGPNAAICVYAELDPLYTPEIRDAVPLAEVQWDGARICRISDIRPISSRIEVPSRSNALTAVSGAIIGALTATGIEATELVSDDFRDPYRLRLFDPARLFKFNDGLRSASLPEAVGGEAAGLGVLQDLWVTQAVRMLSGTNRAIHIALIGRDATDALLNGGDGIVPNVEYRWSTIVDPSVWTSWTAIAPLPGDGHHFRLSVTNNDAFKIQFRFKGSIVGVVAVQFRQDQAALLDLRSTTQGVVFPRLTTVERDLISNPPLGLIIYNTDTLQLEDFNGTVWGAV
jgi:hypothetical protein